MVKKSFNFFLKGFLIFFIFCFSFFELKNLPPVKKEPISLQVATSHRTYSINSRDDEKRNLVQEIIEPAITSDDVLPFMDLVRSLLVQYPQIKQYEMQKKIINNLYDGLMNNKAAKNNK